MHNGVFHRPSHLISSKHQRVFRFRGVVRLCAGEAESRVEDAEPVAALRAAQFNAQSGVLPAGQGKAAVIPGSKSKPFQPQAGGLGTVGAVQCIVRGVLQRGQSGLQRRRGLLRGVGPGHCFRDGRQHGVPHLQFQQLVVPGIAVGQDMQPDRISPHPGGGALVPVGQRGKYKRQRQPQANAQLQHTAGMARHNTFPLSTGVWDERGNSKHYFFAPNRRRTVTRGPPWVGLQR